jgi:Flp pilus assembly protein TadD
MIAVLALAAAAAAGAGPLQAAETAFAQGDYARADVLATAAAEPPQEGAALYLAGLARFRAGHPAAALDALDRAARASDPPAPGLFHYNRAACLYELERFGEAEADYLQAASLDPSLATLSLVNASYAALEGGAPERAREIATRARTSAKPAEADLVADLESHIGIKGSERATAEYREGLAAYDAGRFAEARKHFRRASELDPADGRSLIMSGASSYQLGARSQARVELNDALKRSLDEPDARTARDYLQALSGGLSSRKSWEGAVRLAAGFDNDPLQTGFLGDDIVRVGTVETASGMATADVVLVMRPRLREGIGAELAYVFNQVAYLTDPASDLSLQQHELSSALELAVRDDLRFGVAVNGQLSFTGAARFRGLQAAAGGSTWAALDEGDGSTTRVDVGWTRKEGLGNDFYYLSGSRIDAALSQQMRLKSLTLDVGYRFRAELIGTVQETVAGQSFVDPLAYLGNAVWASARISGAYGTLDLTTGYELRSHLDESVAPGGNGREGSDRHRRSDRRWFGGFGASAALTRNLSLSLRYDLLLNRSNGGGNSGPERQADLDSRSYDRHILLLGTTVTW